MGNSVPLLSFGASAMDVVCPTCGAGIDEECRPGTGVLVRGQPHPVRAEISPEYARYHARATGVAEAEALESRARHLYETTPSAIALTRAVAWERLADTERASWLLLARVPPAPPPTEAVDHPAHYGGKDDPYEAIKVIEAWELDFCTGNTVKYISRAGKKDPSKNIEDLEKARWYLDRRIQQLRGGKKT